MRAWVRVESIVRGRHGIERWRNHLEVIRDGKGPVWFAGGMWFVYFALQIALMIALFVIMGASVGMMTNLEDPAALGGPPWVAG